MEGDSRENLRGMHTMACHGCVGRMAEGCRGLPKKLGFYKRMMCAWREWQQYGNSLELREIKSKRPTFSAPFSYTFGVISQKFLAQSNVMEIFPYVFF